jgi:lysophospholipase L1-like esterase
MRGLLIAVLLLGGSALLQAQDMRAIHTLLSDWGGLIRYGSEDTELRAPKPGENRVVFLGDDITDFWGQEFFAGKPYLNRGIAHQTTPQMLVRFRQDVISLDPAVVVIQAGANDIARLTGPGTQGMMIENFESMVELAQVHGIKVVLASILPVCDCTETQTVQRPIGKILNMNEWLKDYAKQKGAVYLDYHSALVDGREFKQSLTKDGFLPNEAGYKVMAPLAEKAIAEALSR